MHAYIFLKSNFVFVSVLTCSNIWVCFCFFFSRYGIHSQVSVAANIPKQSPDLKTVFQMATAAAVEDKFNLPGRVYPGDKSDGWVVAAKPIFQPTHTDHAESLVLDNIKPLVDNSNGNDLVFYSYYNPCGSKCTNMNNKFNIISRINRVIPNWTHKAFVFSEVFKKTGSESVADVTTTSLTELGNSQIGRANIYRCYNLNNTFQCIKCFNNQNVEQKCVQ